jgi:hypothetical protein
MNLYIYIKVCVCYYMHKLFVSSFCINLMYVIRCTLCFILYCVFYILNTYCIFYPAVTYEPKSARPVDSSNDRQMISAHSHY